MSGECDKCGEHALNCYCVNEDRIKYNRQKGIHTCLNDSTNYCESLCPHQQNDQQISVKQQVGMMKEDECKYKVGIKFEMPFGGPLEIRASGYIDEDLVCWEEVIEGIFYRVYWNGKYLPWSAHNQIIAYAMASGCQWMANEMHKE